RDQMQQPPVSTTHIVMNERGKIHFHETKQGAEIEELSPQVVPILVVIERVSHHQRNDPDQNDVVAGNARSRIHIPEELAWYRVVPAHAVKESSGPQVRAHARTNRGEQKSGRHNDE